MLSSALVSIALAAYARSQQVGTAQAENHPSLSWSKCTSSGCTSQQGSVVLDANWRWTHITDGYTNCYTGNTWNASVCSDGAECAQNCAVDGADYSGVYGITTSGDSLSLRFVTGNNVGSRVYLMASDSEYEMFDFGNNEFTFDVDVSKLPCGLNGAMYFSEMDADGGMSKYPGNAAGAKYGTFINGEANSEGWTGSPNDTNAGTGNYGACCNEMDIWEANSVSTAVTPHPCTVAGLSRCEGTACGGADNRYGTVCDPDGCDWNPYRMGQKDFYGTGKTVDTSTKFTVVTQFIGSPVNEIRRIYVQGGEVIQNVKSTIPGLEDYDSISDAFCDAQKEAFGDERSYQDHGSIGAMFKAPMVAVFSVWADFAANMLWLDSNYPTDGDPSTPGIARGTCSTDSGKPEDVIANYPDSSVTFSAIKFGPLNSTFTAV
ncbi:glycoside hydrolase [Auriculariales sp. MPI-PUGE-AT-0066]|nr:glycoside hydrolase [Auriculariales sp. MPI-PUGE-AT-0066]